MSAEDLHDNPRPRWLVGCVMIMVACLLMPMATCRLGEAGIRRNMLHPPQVNTSILGVQLRARTIDFTPMCDISQKVCDALAARDARVYIVWTDMHWPGEPWARHYPIISIPLDPRPVR